MTEEEGIAAMKMCLGEVRKRLVANLANFMVVIIDRNGIRRLPDF
jgi:20S proteasome alpha/beta subunit